MYNGNVTFELNYVGERYRTFENKVYIDGNIVPKYERIGYDKNIHFTLYNTITLRNYK